MKLTFFGAAKSVTGSNFLLENGEGKILVDCGLHQGSGYCEKHNFEKFEYDPSSIDAVLVTHAHIDHIGRLPRLYSMGFRGKVFSTLPTKDFAEHLLIDSEDILRREAERHGVKPLYVAEDVHGLLGLWHGVRYHESVRVNGFEASFYDAGHVLGSASILVSSSDGKRIIFSGDLGNSPAPMIKDREDMPEADYVVMESTYGARLHEDVSSRDSMLEDTIEETAKAGGTLMIPAFALERTQELLFAINEFVENRRIPQMPVFIDSPLAIKLTGVYKKYSHDPMFFNKDAITLLRSGDAIFDFPNLSLTLTSEQSKSIARVPAPKIIIAGSGMSQGGRILRHEAAYLPDPNSALLIVGYQVRGSLGRRILDGEKTVKIFGEDIPVRARVSSIGSYSAHADQSGLMSWLKPMRLSLQKVFLVHGEEEEMNPLAGKIRDELAVPTHIPSIGEEVVL